MNGINKIIEDFNYAEAYMISDEDINKMTTEEIAIALKQLMDANGSTPSSPSEDSKDIDLESEELDDLDSDIDEDELDDLLLDDDDEDEESE